MDFLLEAVNDDSARAFCQCGKLFEVVVVSLVLQYGPRLIWPALCERLWSHAFCPFVGYLQNNPPKLPYLLCFFNKRRSGRGCDFFGIFSLAKGGQGGYSIRRTI